MAEMPGGVQGTKEDERRTFTAHVEGLVAVCTAFLDGDDLFI